MKRGKITKEVKAVFITISAGKITSEDVLHHQNRI